MQWHTGSWWELVFRASLPCTDDAAAVATIPALPHSIEYKYVVRRKDGEVVWESCQNRVLRMQKAVLARDALLVVDVWDHPEMQHTAWGQTEADKAAAAARERELDKRATEDGLRLFRESLARAREESAKKHLEMEAALIATETRKLENLEKERVKRMSRRGRSSSPSPIPSPATSPIPAHSPGTSPPPFVHKMLAPGVAKVLKQ
jgi:hypothetical protein